MLAGVADLRTGEHQTKKAKRALEQLDGTPVPRLPQAQAASAGGSAAQSVPVRVYVDGVEHVLTAVVA